MKWTLPVGRLILIVLGALAVAGGLAPVAAEVSCGDTITANTRLQGDLTCATNPALTVEGPAKLSLNGYTVTCEDAAHDGIVITGDNAHVQNGTVRGCDNGVLVQGAGGHRVKHVRAEGNRDGIDVNSNNNVIVHNATIDSDNDGIELDGDHNRARNNHVSGSGDEGIEVDGDDNEVVKNTVVDTANDGICVDGEEAKIIRNHVSTSGDNGIELDSDGEHQVIGNRSENNGAAGIAVFEGSINNVLHRNTASGNSAFDLSDANADCDTNHWSVNQGTANQACIQ